MMSRPRAGGCWLCWSITPRRFALGGIAPIATVQGSSMQAARSRNHCNTGAMSRDVNTFGRDVIAVEERELKLAIEWDFVLPDLTPALSSDEHVSTRRPVVLEAVYFDTSDLALLNAGVTLRRRRGGSDSGWHLKIPRSSPGHRTEFQLPAKSSGSIPKEFKRLVADVASHRKLRPVLHMRTDRTVTNVVGIDSEVLAVGGRPCTHGATRRSRTQALAGARDRGAGH